MDPKNNPFVNNARNAIQALYAKPQTCKYYTVIATEQRAPQVQEQMPQPSNQHYYYYQTPISYQTQPKKTAQPKCPESLRDYIKNSFFKCNSDTDRQYMEKVIKGIIQEAKINGTFYTKNWGSEPLPLLEREMQVIQNNSHSSQRAAQVMPPRRREGRKSRFSLFEVEESVPSKRLRPSSPKRQPSPQRIPKRQKLEVPRFIPPPEDQEQEKAIIGTSTQIEKPFFRSSGATVDPSTVRPEPILRRALTIFQNRWKKGEIDYEYFGEQLRSIRQDLTVQQIKNNFTVEVYQVHIRLALEAADLDQFCSCMGRLFELYKEGFTKHKHVRSIQEFLAYRLIYFSLQFLYIELEKYLKTITQAELESPEVRHALQMKAAILNGNYHQVFRLRKTAPNMGIHLLNIFVDRLRMMALLKMVKTQLIFRYNPSLPISFVTTELGFDSEDECREFIKTQGGIMDNEIIKSKESLSEFRNSSLLLQQL